MENIIAEGAEAKIIQISPTILKKLREKKTYRIPEIDLSLRKTRSKSEFKILNILYKNKVNVPKPIELITTKDEISFTFEYINANTLKEELNKTKDKNLILKAFNQIINIHNLDIVHFDLTTLNMLVKDNQIYLIDFGLAKITNKIEEKGVDLNLFFTCIKNEHPDFYYLKDELINMYLKKNKNKAKEIIKRLENIENRGRNKK